MHFGRFEGALGRDMRGLPQEADGPPFGVRDQASTAALVTADATIVLARARAGGA